MLIHARLFLSDYFNLAFYYFAHPPVLFNDDRFIDVTHLHLADWLNCIRNGGRPSCHIELAFQEAITVLMATRSYKEGRKVFWDKDREEVYT